MRLILATLLGSLLSIAYAFSVQASAPLPQQSILHPLQQACQAKPCNQQGSCASCATRYEAAAGGYVCCPVKRDANGMLRPPTPAEMEAFRMQVDQLMSTV